MQIALMGCKLLQQTRISGPLSLNLTGLVNYRWSYWDTANEERVAEGSIVAPHSVNSKKPHL